MQRGEAIKFHREEAAAARRIAEEAPGSAGSRELLAQAGDHDAHAEMAEVGEYPTDLTD